MAVVPANHCFGMMVDFYGAVMKECQGHWEEIVDTLGAGQVEQIPDEFKVTLVVHHQSLLRTKRCLLAYLQNRLDKIRDLRWETGPVIPPNLQAKLSDKEQQFFGAYDGILSNYIAHYSALNITASSQPPKELSVEVRVLQDCGEVMTEQGPVNLEQGTSHFLRRADIESLIREGKLEHVQSN